MLPIIFRFQHRSTILLISTIFIVINLTDSVPYAQYGYDRSLNEVVEVCNTQDCIDDAHKILSNMDTTVDPCDNFYDFVCGNFTRNAEFLPGLPLVDSLSKITHEISKKLESTFESGIYFHDPNYVVKLKNYYNLCMDEETILSNSKRELLVNLKREGLIGWPVYERHRVGTRLHRSRSSGRRVDQHYAKRFKTKKLHNNLRTLNENEEEEIPPELRPPRFPEWRNLPKMVNMSATTPDTDWKTAPVNWTIFDPDDKWNIQSFRPTKGDSKFQLHNFGSQSPLSSYKFVGQSSYYQEIPIYILTYPGTNEVMINPEIQTPTIPAIPGQFLDFPGDPVELPPYLIGIPGQTPIYQTFPVYLPPYQEAPEQIHPIPVAPSQTDMEFNWASNDVLLSKNGFFFSAFLELRVLPDPASPTRRKLCIFPPSFSTPSLSDPGASAIHYKYFDFMKRVAKSLEVRESGHSELYEIHVFQMELAKLAEDARRNQMGIPAIKRVVELEKSFPMIVNWYVYLDKLLTPYIKLSPNDYVTVFGDEYFKKFDQLVGSKPRRVLANYAYWRAIEKAIPYWSQKYAEILRTISVGKTDYKPSRAEYCTSIISHSLMLGTGALYVKNHVDKSTKQATAEIFSDLRNTFRNILETSNWIDAATKAEALKKLDKMLPLIGYPPEYENSIAVDAYYNDLTISPTSFLVSSLNLNIFSFGKMMKLLLKPERKDDWTSEFGKSATANAFYYPFHNSIIFPAGILQPPFFKVSNPKYMNYARLGHIVGHEMTHGFDTIGSQFNADGEAQNWWHNGTRELFLRRVQCIIDQYSAYVYKDLNLNLNGTNGQQENVADNGGLKMAYMAYKTWSERNFGREERRLPGLENYSSKQMFWISFANSQCARYQRDIISHQIKYDGHAPNNFRVIGTVSNNPEFGTDFKCPKGTPMNPHQKCAVW